MMKRGMDDNWMIAVNIFYDIHPQLQKFLDGHPNWQPMDTSDDPLNRVLNEWQTLKVLYDDYQHLPSYIGHNHYRRLFRPSDLLDYRKYDGVVMKGIPMLFRTTDMKVVSGTIETGYAICHIHEDWLKMETLIPESDKAKWEEWKLQRQMNSPCVMFLLKKELFKEMYEYVYPKLIRLKEMIDLTGRDNYQKRALAFLGERLFSFWVFRSDIKVKEVECEFHPEWKPLSAKDRRGDYR